MTHLEAPDAPDIERDPNHRLLKSMLELKYYEPESHDDDASTRFAYHGGQTVSEAVAWERIMIDGTLVFMNKQSGFVTHKSPLRFEKSF